MNGTRRRPGSGGRPSKGDRHLFATRIPVPVAEAVMEAAEALGLSYSEFLALLAAEAMGMPELAPHPRPVNQEELPLNKTA